ncbi:chain-length determining protein [Pacificimonas sp. WHA3]|uniref:Chain-length determining protein n=1 Tax=Pacificimonas pallii TaxID=2827236 RepID=A0ABS6SFC7_9SPHN|nr:XrtA system polysaccharide chain length determinant [Pacificimonas pallii]MBV7257112.1 chain-length determining protein [Pacificimonas pallii]
MTTLYGVWRKRWWTLLIAWLVCLAGWAFVATIPNSYQSSARILVESSSIIQREMGGGGDGRELDIVRQTLTSRLNLEKVLRRTEMDLGLVDDAAVDAAITELSDNITVGSQSGNLFTISYQASDGRLSDQANADRARSIVDNLLQIFMEENVTADRDDINEAIRFFEDQLAQRERELEASEKRRAEFEEKYLGQLPGEGNISERLSGARVELADVQLELAQARSSLAALTGQLGGTPRTMGGGVSRSGIAPGIITPARQRANVIEEQISQLRAAGRLEGHPDVVLARQQLARLEVDAAREEAELKESGGGFIPSSNPAYINLQSMILEKRSQVAALGARASRLQAAITDLEVKQQEQPGIAAEQARLNRDYNVLRRQYEALLESREEIRLQSDVQTQTQQVRFSVVDPPSQPREPVAPNRPVLLSLVFVAALGAGIAAAFLASQLRASFVTAGQLESQFDVPVVGSVSEIVTEADRAQNRVRLAGFTVLSLGLVAIYGALLLYELV